MIVHNADLRAWLATPDAAEHLDLARLGTEDASRWREIRTTRRRRDWASSRALLAAVPATGACSRSMSHSHGYAALVLADPALRVGIDVETMVLRNFLRMAEIAYSPPEARHLATLDPALLAGRFYEFWTLKEAFAKALKLSLAEALTQCRCVDTAGNLVPSIPTAQPWRATVFAPRPDLRLAVACVADSAGQLRVRIHTKEWPAPAPSQWPVMLDLADAAGTCVAVPEASPFANS
jgi:4'-phosphopantetheinyl transferase